MTAAPKVAADVDLARRAAKGDRAAFNALVRLNKDALYRFIRRYIGDAEEAYDILQDSFVAAWQAIGRLDPERPVIVWLRRIALNKCRDWGRRRAVRKFFYRAGDIETANVANAADEGGAEEEAVARLDRAIAQLPTQLKEPLLLTAFEGMSHDEAAAALGVTSKAIETRVYRARKTLATILNAEGSDDD